MNTEQRKRKRLLVWNEAFAAFIKPDEPVIVGKIMDISQCGLAVRYLAPEKIGEGFTSVRIFGPDFHPTSRIVCKVVYDEVVSEESWGGVSVRRCGIEFNRVASLDVAKLKNLMHHERGDAAEI